MLLHGTKNEHFGPKRTKNGNPDPDMRQTKASKHGVKNVHGPNQEEEDHEDPR